MSQQTTNYMQTLNEISQHVLLVIMQISWPKLRYQISDAIVEVNTGSGSSGKETISEELRSNPQWQLMPDEWRKKLTRIESQARTILAASSISFGARGMSVLPITRAESVFSSLSDLREQMNTFRDEFAENYSSILEDMRMRLGDTLFRKVVAKLPEPRDVASKFDMSWAVIPIGGMDGVSVGDIVTIESVLNDMLGMMREQHADTAIEERDIARRTADLENALNVARSIHDQLTTHAVRQMNTDDAHDLINDARMQTRAMVQSLLENMATEPRRILAEATANLVDALQSPLRHVRTSTIKQVQEAFELVEGFSFMADRELLQAMQECRRQLENSSPQAMNADENINNSIVAGLQVLHAQALNINTSSEAMRSPRNIRI